MTHTQSRSAQEGVFPAKNVPCNLTSHPACHSQPGSSSREGRKKTHTHNSVLGSAPAAHPSPASLCTSRSPGCSDSASRSLRNVTPKARRQRPRGLTWGWSRTQSSLHPHAKEETGFARRPCRLPVPAWPSLALTLASEL